MAIGAGIVWPAWGRRHDVVGAAQRVGVIGAAALAAAALSAIPNAKADPPPGCVVLPGPPADCAMRAFEVDIAAAGYGDANGNRVAVDQGLDMCGLMDRGLSRPEMESQFLRDNPGLGPTGATRVVGFAINDLCPWHR